MERNAHPTDRPYEKYFLIAMLPQEKRRQVQNEPCGYIEGGWGFLFCGVLGGLGTGNWKSLGQ